MAGLFYFFGTIAFITFICLAAPGVMFAIGAMLGILFLCFLLGYLIAAWQDYAKRSSIGQRLLLIGIISFIPALWVVAYLPTNMFTVHQNLTKYQDTDYYTCSNGKIITVNKWRMGKCYL